MWDRMLRLVTLKNFIRLCEMGAIFLLRMSKRYAIAVNDKKVAVKNVTF